MYIYMLWPKLEFNPIQNSSRRNWNIILMKRELEEIPTIRTRGITHNGESEGAKVNRRVRFRFYSVLHFLFTLTETPSHRQSDLPLTLNIIRGTSCSNCWYFFKFSVHQNNIPISSGRILN